MISSHSIRVEDKGPDPAQSQRDKGLNETIQSEICNYPLRRMTRSMTKRMAINANVNENQRVTRSTTKHLQEPKPAAIGKGRNI